MGTLGKVVSGIFWLVLLAVFQGWVLTVLWGWFVVPVFGAPLLSIAYAIGLSVTLGMFVGLRASSDNKPMSEYFFYAYFATFLSLSIGFAASLFR